MTVTLVLKQVPDIPIEAESITPCNLAGKSLKEIGALEVYQGNQTLTLREFFEIGGSAGDDPSRTDIVVTGDLRRVKMIGRRMNGGSITIAGDVGMYLGAEMVAGRIHVRGNVGAWAAAEMKGGNIQIEGNAGDCLCAGYRGSQDGMTGGRVFVAGNVGTEMASHIRRGLIAVRGDVSELCAARMQGGTIIVGGQLGPRVGIEASRGMIIALGRVERVLPTYRYSGTSEREFIGYYLRYLRSRRPDFVPRTIDASERWVKYVGDFAESDPRTELYFRPGLTRQSEG
ncbi:MAG: formylmethanofuran dehydrogenase subunit C [Candidatus Thorarchaeota archaeon]